MVALARLATRAMPSRYTKYVDTVLEFSGDAGVTSFDLRRHLSATDVAVLAGELGVGPPFAVITAHNPDGIGQSTEQNAAAERRLRDVVAQRGLAHRLADGLDPARTHREAALAVMTPLAEARALASEFGQDAIFWFEGRRFWLVGVADDFAARLPLQRGPDHSP